MKIVLMICFSVLFFLSPWCLALEFKIASYNVQNLFDLRQDGTEYPAYIPFGQYGWNKEVFEYKLDNIAKVIKILKADVVALQEVESLNTLHLLRAQLKKIGVDYPHAAAARQNGVAIRCGLLSKFPITAQEDIRMPNQHDRSILKATLDIDDHPLILFINHWKSKYGPESRRVAIARILHQACQSLEPRTDFIIIGDFNSNYNEYQTLAREKKLDDTKGITGINHILKTIRKSKLVSKTFIKQPQSRGYLYNLWLELAPYQRWSYNIFGRKSTIDNILVPHSLFDDYGISYLDLSYHRFMADLLFKNNAVFRWKRAKGGRGRHLGEGISDHLPVTARFTTTAFKAKQNRVPDPNCTKISNLYNSKKLKVYCRLIDCIVIYQQGDNTIIKQRDDRAILIYRAGKYLKLGYTYDLMVTKLKKYYGLHEITGLRKIKSSEKPIDITDLYLDGQGLDLSAPNLENEILNFVKGRYKNKDLHYNNKKIQLYFKKGIRKPQQGAFISLSKVRVGFHQRPELVVASPQQIQKEEY